MRDFSQGEYVLSRRIIQHEEFAFTRWSRPISTDDRVEKAPFTVILAIVNVVVEGCNRY